MSKRPSSLLKLRIEGEHSTAFEQSQGKQVNESIQADAKSVPSADADDTRPRTPLAQHHSPHLLRMLVSSRESERESYERCMVKSKRNGPDVQCEVQNPQKSQSKTEDTVHAKSTLERETPQAKSQKSLLQTGGSVSISSHTADNTGSAPIDGATARRSPSVATHKDAVDQATPKDHLRARRASSQFHPRHIGSIPLISTGKKIDVVQRSRLYVRARSITSAVPGVTKETLKKLCPVFGLEWFVVNTAENEVMKCFEKISSKKPLCPMLMRVNNKWGLFALLSTLEEHFSKVESKERPTTLGAVEIARKELAKTPEWSGVVDINGHSVTRVVLDGKVYFSGRQVLSAVSNSQQHDEATHTNSVMRIVSVFTTGIEYVLGPPAVMKVLDDVDTTSAQRLTSADFRVFKVGDEELFHVVLKQMVEERPIAGISDPLSMTSEYHSNHEALSTKCANGLLHPEHNVVAQPSETTETPSTVSNESTNAQLHDAQLTQSGDGTRTSTCKERSTCDVVKTQRYAGTFCLRNPSKKELSGSDRELVRKHGLKSISCLPLRCIVLDGKKYCFLSDVHRLVPHKLKDDIVKVCRALGLHTSSEKVEITDRETLLKTLEVVMGLPDGHSPATSVQDSTDRDTSFSTRSKQEPEGTGDVNADKHKCDVNPDKHLSVSGQSQQYLDGGIISVGRSHSKVPWLYHQQVDMVTVCDVEKEIPAASLDGVQRYEMPQWGPEVLNRYAAKAGLKQVYHSNQQLVPLRSLDIRDCSKGRASGPSCVSDLAHEGNDELVESDESAAVMCSTPSHTGHSEDVSEDVSQGVQRNKESMDVGEEEHRSLTDDMAERSVVVEVAKTEEQRHNVTISPNDICDDVETAVNTDLTSEDKVRTSPTICDISGIPQYMADPGDVCDENENENGTGELDFCNVKKEEFFNDLAPCSNMHQADDSSWPGSIRRRKTPDTEDIVEGPPCKRHCASLGPDPEAEDKGTGNVTQETTDVNSVNTNGGTAWEDRICISSSWSTASDEPPAAPIERQPPLFLVSEREQLKNELKWETVAEGPPIPVVERDGSRYVLTSDVASLLRGVDAGDFMDALAMLELSIAPCSPEIGKCFSAEAGKPTEQCRSMVKLHMTLGATVKMLLMIFKDKRQQNNNSSDRGPHADKTQTSWEKPLPEGRTATMITDRTISRTSTTSGRSDESLLQSNPFASPEGNIRTVVTPESSSPAGVSHKPSERKMKAENASSCLLNLPTGQRHIQKEMHTSTSSLFPNVAEPRQSHAESAQSAYGLPTGQQQRLSREMCNRASSPNKPRQNLAENANAACERGLPMEQLQAMYNSASSPNVSEPPQSHARSLSLPPKSNCHFSPPLPRGDTLSAANPFDQVQRGRRNVNNFQRLPVVYSSRSHQQHMMRSGSFTESVDVPVRPHSQPHAGSNREFIPPHLHTPPSYSLQVDHSAFVPYTRAQPRDVAPTHHYHNQPIPRHHLQINYSLSSHGHGHPLTPTAQAQLLWARQLTPPTSRDIPPPYSVHQDHNYNVPSAARRRSADNQEPPHRPQ